MAGYTNNNPGNIRKSSTTWKGEVPSSTPFEKFSTEVYGFRALIKNFQTLILRGDNTIWKAIHEWAPWGDGQNNPDSYSRRVEQMTGIPVSKTLSAGDYFALGKIASAISIVEHGFPPNYQNLANIQAAVQILQAEAAAGQGASPQVTPNTNTGGDVWAQVDALLNTTITQSAQTAQTPVTLPDGTQTPYMMPPPKKSNLLWWGLGALAVGTALYMANQPKNKKAA